VAVTVIDTFRFTVTNLNPIGTTTRIDTNTITEDCKIKVTERTIHSNGQMLLVPEIEIESYWTSLPDDEMDIIRLYHEHGTCEQFHSEIKTDLDLERLPSGKFATNNLILHMGLMAYNILRILGQRRFSCQISWCL